MDATTLDRMLSDPLLDLPSKASRLGWLLDCADQLSLPLDVFLDDDELVGDLARLRVRRLEFANAVVRRRNGLSAAAVWMGRPNAALEGRRPSELLDNELDHVLDAAWGELDDPSGDPDALATERDPAIANRDDAGAGDPS